MLTDYSRQCSCTYTLVVHTLRIGTTTSLRSSLVLMSYIKYILLQKIWIIKEHSELYSQKELASSPGSSVFIIGAWGQLPNFPEPQFPQLWNRNSYRCMYTHTCMNVNGDNIYIVEFLRYMWAKSWYTWPPKHTS